MTKEPDERRRGKRGARAAAVEVAEAPAAESPKPEVAFVARRPVPEPPRPLPSTHHAIFFDVENTSRLEHVARLLDHLVIDRQGQRAELVAIGNWRVIGADTARLLARHGAQLLHSAPSTGVPDWSDLRIAVSAGVWLAGARPGDVLEVVSDDRAFDAVGDVAVSLGVTYRRVSYRALAGEIAAAPEPGPARHRRGRRRGGSESAPLARGPMPARAPESHRVAVPAAAHTAPHDEVVDLVRELVPRAPNGAVLIDTLANELKARGFRRTPGSPRLITRLRRMKELAVSATGMITLVGSPGTDGGAPEPEEAVEAMPLEAVSADTLEAAAPAGEAAPATRRRRRRRGGRRRRRGPAPVGEP